MFFNPLTVDGTYRHPTKVIAVNKECLEMIDLKYFKS